jgi:hypothetical protein
MTSLARRTFLKKSSCAGLASIFGALTFPETLFGMGGSADQLHQKPVCSVKKEIYVAYTKPRQAPMTSMSYIGKGLRREEFRSFMQSSDWNEAVMKRTSDNNGHTWSDWIEEPKQAHTNGEFTQSGGAFQIGSATFDPVSGQLIKPVFHRIFKGAPQVALKEIWKGNRLFWDHGFYQLSGDDGKTWGVSHQLKYEDGPDFNSSDWGNQEFLKTNEMYIGNSIVLKNGSLLISATIPVPYRDVEDEKNPSIFPNNYREGCVAGAICFIGRWNPTKMDYDWKKSKPVFLPRHVSTRGLTELDISELTNGKLLLIMRGSNAGLDIAKSPGRKWFSVSSDGGFTWDDVTDMKYIDGEQFYSSATISKTIRSSKTGKLYWVGNITNVPPKGNSPRYPLQIVEIDEQGPSFRKEGMTVIDDRDPKQDSEFLQLSNFSLLENRETKNLEIYLTRLGENGGGEDTWTANAYKYTLVLK